MIRYIGAKNPLKDWILESCPQNPINWIEPFGGMFSIFFTLDLNQFPHTRFIYNEVNPHHLNLFHHLKDPSFRQELKREIINESIYLKSFTLYELGGSIGALSWLRILCGAGDLRNILNPQYGGSPAWFNLIESLDEREEHFNRMEIENLNYDQCLKKWDQDGTFFYLDPPYFGYEHYYTYHNFGYEEHKNLRDLLQTLKSKWVLSYYNFPELESWYSNQVIEQKKFNLSTEYKISNSIII